jgi:hypothetical protein
MAFGKMRPMHPLKMGNETYQLTKGASRHSKGHGLISLSKTYMKAELKETS